MTDLYVEAQARKLIYSYMKKKYVVEGALSEPFVSERKHRYYLRKYLREVVREKYPKVPMGRCEELAREMLPGIIEERREYVGELAMIEVAKFELTLPTAEPVVERGGCLHVEYKGVEDRDLRQTAVDTGCDVEWTDLEVVEKIRAGDALEVYGARFQRQRRAAQ